MHLGGSIKATKADPTAKEDVFANYDLLSVVISSLKDTTEGRAVLSKAALVCQSFKEPALDALWEKLDSCVPLLKLLPNLKESESTYYFYGDIASSSFAEYARRVRDLTLRDVEEPVKVSGQLFARLAKQLQGQPLLPGLRRIRIDSLGGFTSDVLELLPSPSIQSVEFRGKSLARSRSNPYSRDPSYPYLPIFPSFTTALPSLTRLVLSQNERLPDGALTAVLRLSSLRTLVLQLPGTPINSEFLISLHQQLPQLRNLWLDLSLIHPSNRCLQSLPIKDQWLPDLENFQLTLRHGSTCHFTTKGLVFCPSIRHLGFIQRITAVTLLVTRVSISFEDFVRTLCSAPNLRRIKFTQGKEDSAIHLLTPGIVKFLDVPSLEEIIVDTDRMGVSRTGDGTMVQTLVDAAYKSWKRDGKATIRKLVLPNHEECCASPSDLEYVSRHAVGLEHFSISVDTGDFQRTSKLDKPPTLDFIKTSTVRHLEIGDWRSNKEFTLMENSYMAQWLDRIFPNLESLTPYTDSRGKCANYVENWFFIEHLRKKEKASRCFFSY
ncbi:hypothetical protein CC2G_014455 [Coprinopsis cinerea AmutBmut pab1-1]|nr:hypothetical protein CC2G_014455 [Coprinopsis cinerea AmutBmut pab1-1]